MDSRLRVSGWEMKHQQLIGSPIQAGSQTVSIQIPKTSSHSPPSPRPLQISPLCIQTPLYVQPSIKHNINFRTPSPLRTSPLGPDAPHNTSCSYSTSPTHYFAESRRWTPCPVPISEDRSHTPRQIHQRMLPHQVFHSTLPIVTHTLPLKTLEQRTVPGSPTPRFATEHYEPKVDAPPQIVQTRDEFLLAAKNVLNHLDTTGTHGKMEKLMGKPRILTRTPFDVQMDISKILNWKPLGAPAFGGTLSFSPTFSV